MLLVDSLAEEQILSAIRRGEFEDLPGQGQPLNLDDDNGVPEELRVAFRLLRNAGCLPAEIGLRNEIHEVETLLGQVEIDAEQQSLRRRLCLLRARLGAQGRETNLLIQDSDYRAKLMRRMAANDRGPGMTDDSGSGRT